MKKKTYTQEDINELRDGLHECIDDAVRLFAFSVEGRSVEDDLQTLNAVDLRLKTFVSTVAASINVCLRKKEQQ